MEQHDCPYWGTDWGYNCPEGYYGVCFSEPCDGPPEEKSGFVVIDEVTPFDAKQMQAVSRMTKIRKLANMLRQIKYPVFPGGSYTADLGVQFGDHVYEVIAESLIDNGVEVDVVHCGECKYLNKKVDCGGFCKCGEVNGGTPTMRVNWGYCDYGERKNENE